MLKRLGGVVESPSFELRVPSAVILAGGFNAWHGFQTKNIQIHDLHGNTATTIDLDTKTATPWQTFDEYGNPTTTNQTGLINYNSYSQAERATNQTGLILMGARVYNPTTNQFTSPDPITGGNENPYTYPNDPVNRSDFTGQIDFLLKLVISTALDIALTAVLAALTVAGGVIGLLLIAAKGALVSGLTSIIGMMIDKDFSEKAFWAMGIDMLVSALISNPLAKKISTIRIKEQVAKMFGKLVKKIRTLIENFVGLAFGENVLYWLDPLLPSPPPSKAPNPMKASVVAWKPR